MNLYLVTCVRADSFGSHDKMDVYAVARDPSIAGELALNLMKSFDYKFKDRVDNIKLLASDTSYDADNLLVIQS
jgi:hypothetical protein